MEEAEFIPRIASMVRECEDYRDELSTDRVRAIEYYDGIMTDTEADEGRSKVVSRDVRAATKKILPSIIRTILGNDEVVEYNPVGSGDEDGAAQASDYINYVVLPESGGYDAIHDAIHDALRLKNGVLKWWYEEKKEVHVSRHSGLLDDAWAQLVNDDDVEVLEHSEREETVEAEGQPPQMVMVHDVKIKRMIVKRMPKAACIPLEEFLIHPDATDPQDSLVTGQKCSLRRTDLVAMGYDKKDVENLPLAEDANEETEESARRGENYRYDSEDESDPALQEVDYYELYIRTDLDGDGIAELRRMCFGGKVSLQGLLKNEECDEVQFCTIKCERKPHQWEGVSVADDVMEIQRIKTVLLRQTLDNIYWQNNPQPIYQEGKVTDLDPLLNPDFGRPIPVAEGVSVKDALGFNNVPFVAKDSFAMLEYLDNETTDRTGISDASSGMAPDALQNMTAKASAMVEAAGIGQTEMIVRCVANDLKVFFRGLLRLIIRHQDVPRTVRLRDEWKTYDPRDWNAEMDCTVNTGLGAGTRERDMMMMQLVIGVQEKLLTGLGPDNPFIKPDNVYNAIAKLIESAGLKTPSMYVTEPDPQEVQQKLEAARNQPNPEMEKLKMQAQAKQAEMQMKAQEGQAKAQLELQKLREDAALKRENMAHEFQLKQEQINAEMALKRDQLTAELQLKRELSMAELAMKRDIASEQAAAQSTATSGVHMGGEPG